MASGVTFRPYIFIGIIACCMTKQALAVTDYCDGRTFHAVCDEDEVVVITHARYGRMSLGECLVRDYGNIGCASDITGQMDAWCSGRRSCEVRVSSIVDVVRGTEHPCPMDLRSYLESAYQCLRVVQPSTTECDAVGYDLLNLTEPGINVGYLASLTTESTGIGSISCPWRLSVSPGKRVNFTLFDFAAILRDPFNYDRCQQVYATIKDNDAISTVKICNGENRVAHAYLSESNNVEVRIFTQDGNTDNKYFILKYEAVGCTDPEPPVNGWIERVGEMAVVKCNGTSATWELHCENQAWRGEIFSVCPPEGHIFPLSTNNNPDFGDVLWNFISGAHEFSIVIIASIAVIIACAILTLGLICIKRRREIEDERRAQKDAEIRASGYYEAAPKVDPRIHSRGVPGMPGEVFPPNENDYYRTWQLQRHAQNPQYSAQRGSLPNPHEGAHNSHQGVSHQYPASYYPPESDSGFSYQDQVEHIYESPKFAHKDLDLQYYELDPSLTMSSEHETDRRRSSAMSGGL